MRFISPALARSPAILLLAATIPQTSGVSCPGQRGQPMRGDDIADLLAAVDVGAHHGADVAVKLGGAAFRLGLELGAQIGAFGAVDLDQGAAERQLHALVALQSGLQVIAGIADAVGEAGGVERRLGGAGARMRASTSGRISGGGMPPAWWRPSASVQRSASISRPTGRYQTIL